MCSEKKNDTFRILHCLYQHFSRSFRELHLDENVAKCGCGNVCECAVHRLTFYRKYCYCEWIHV